MSSVSCRIAAPWVTALGSGEEIGFTPMRNHIETCLYCQAGIARQRRLRRSLEELAVVSDTAPTGRLSGGTAQRRRVGRSVLVGTIGAAVAVGVGVIGIRRSLTH